MAEISRRHFIQLSVIATTAASGLSGCKNEAVWKEEAAGRYGGMSNKAYPYLNQPYGTIDGVPSYFASTCEMCSAGCGIYVRTLGGRANSISGNPYHPVSRGKSCLRGQLALQHLYNPDRLMRPLRRVQGTDSMTEEEWDPLLARTAASLRAAKGKTAILVDGATIARSPSKLRALQSLATKTRASLTQFSLVDDAPWRAASAAVYGRDQLPDYRIDLADLVVSFGGNFLEAWPSPVYYGRLFGEFRQGARRSAGDHGRFVYVGPRLSMTASKADQWLACRSGTESIVALGVLHELGGGGIPAETAANLSGLSVSQIVDLAAQFRAAGPHSVAMGGDGLFSSDQVTEAFIDIERLNLKTRSTCIQFGSAAVVLPAIDGGMTSLSRLIQRMNTGEIDVLVTVGQVNPAFLLPEQAHWQEAVAKVPFVVSITSFLDETSSDADVALAARTFLEEWGDQIPSVAPSGFKTASMTQPVIDPSFITRRHELDSNNQPLLMMNTREMTDILLDLTARVENASTSATGRGLVRTVWSSIGCADLGASDINNDAAWSKTVSSGGNWSSQTAVVGTSSFRESASAMFPPTEPVANSFSLLLYPHVFYDDGRNANLDWVQEMPDPMSAAVWNSWVEINSEVAESLGIRTGDVVRLTGNSGSIDVPALPFPGIHPQTVAMPIGQGHTGYGRNAEGVGANPLKILDLTTDDATGSLAFSATNVSLTKIADAVSGYHPELNTLVLVQDRPHGEEPAAVKDLIHETAREWKGGAGHQSASPKPHRSRPVI